MNATLHLLVTMAVCLAVVRPLARARWVWRSPRTGILLWQLLGLTTVLCAVGAAFSFGLSPYDRDVPTAVHRWLTGAPARLDAPHVVSLFVGLGLTVALVAGLALSWLAMLRTRRRHRQVLALVAREDSAVPGVLILDHPLTVAYCLPGLRSRVVLSTGALRTLRRDELAAVLAHEQAHARERHDLVLLPFVTLRRLLPASRLTRRAADAVALLVEMRADEQACRSQRAGSLATALRRFAAVTPPGTIGIADTAVRARLLRLSGTPAPLPFSLRALVVVTGLVLVSTPLSFLIW